MSDDFRLRAYACKYYLLLTSFLSFAKSTFQFVHSSPRIALAVFHMVALRGLDIGGAKEAWDYQAGHPKPVKVSRQSTAEGMPATPLKINLNQRRVYLAAQ